MVLIITLNYNQNEFTLSCVHSILKSNYNDFKLLLIDNGSNINNYENLKKNIPKNNKLILKRIEDNSGYVGGINFGLQEGLKYYPDYFLIMNNDTIIDSNAITELVKTCNEFDDRAIVTGKVYHYDSPDVLQDIGYSYLNKKTLQFKRIGLNQIDSGQYNITQERDMIDDVFWLFPVRLYTDIGGYSTYFWFNAEQVDFALRAKKNKYKLIYTPYAKLWHKGSVSIGGRDKNPKLAYWHIQSSLILGFIHLNFVNFFIFFLSILKSVIVTNIKSLLYSLFDNSSLKDYARAKRKGLFYFFKWIFLKNENVGKCPV